jgi:hypothetical protein
MRTRAGGAHARAFVVCLDEPVNGSAMPAASSRTRRPGTRQRSRTCAHSGGPAPSSPYRASCSAAGSVTGSAMPTDPSDELSRPHPSHLRRDTMRRKDDVMSADTRLDELSVSGLGGSGLGGEIRCSVDTREYLGVSCIHQRWTNQPCRSGSTTCDVPETGPDLRHPICPRRSCVNALTRTPELPRTAAPQKPQQ